MSKVYVNTITNNQIRCIFNGARDGTATDAVLRHRCQIALGEQVIADNMHPCGKRYPYADEVYSAKVDLCKYFNVRHEAGEETP